MDRQVSPNSIRNKSAERNRQHCGQMFQYDDQKEELSEPSDLQDCEPINFRVNFFPCDVCGELFPNGLQMERHRQIHITKGEIQTPLHQADVPDLNMDRQVLPTCTRNESAEPKQNRRKTIQHSHGHDEEFSYPSACESSGSGKGSFPFLYEVGGTEFHYKNDFKRQKRTQTGEKLHKCDECNYETLWKRDLTRHMRTHTGEKPYKCDLCNYETANSGHLKVHMRTHTGEKPYKCDLCNYESAQSENLKVHMRTHTGEKPHKCDLCNFESAQRVNLKEHMRTHA